jgi:signal transduction histidine kinase
MDNEADFITVVDDEAGQPAAVPEGPRWKVAVIDDDEAVHDGTRFALQDYALEGRGLELLSARSASDGRALMSEHPDMAVVLLDVVMETDRAGLDLVDFVRNELCNDLVRIILRTGQPGQAPEQRIVVDYDINDYKAKTELTAEKLFTSMTAALRSHEQLRRLHEMRAELQEANLGLEERVRQRTAELVAANRQLESRWARLQRVSSFKNEILGTVAHDLKNPLGVILGRTEMMSELLSAGPAPGEALAAQINHIRDSARRLTAMVDRLIADAMADAADVSLRGDVVDLCAIARDVAEANRPLAQKKQQTISLAGPDVLLLSGDPDRLREAVDNLVSNAVKYGPHGGRAEIRIEEGDGEAVLVVADDGPGLSPEDHDRLFGRFQRLSAKPTGGETSTGLGLSITRRIVELHAGRITGENGLGGGAVFTVFLPLRKDGPVP